MEKSLDEMSVLFEGKKLRCGYTTGSCAAAAAKAAAESLFSGKEQVKTEIVTPNNVRLCLDVKDCRIQKTYAVCGVQKDGGDDPDVTNGMLILASVSMTEDNGSMESGIEIDGGQGVGRVTQEGLEQPVGEAAINRVPRKMIADEVQKVCDSYGFKGRIKVVIEAPEGEKVAVHTFNPRLGILGGISILGTSGIVVPMSEEALIKSIETELLMHIKRGETHLLAAPGNYGEAFISKDAKLKMREPILCSNFVGKFLDLAVWNHVKELTFVSHIGKAIKLSGGIMDTHSKSADCRAELLAAAVLRAGEGGELACRILETVTTEEAVAILSDQNVLEPVMEQVLDRIRFYMVQRSKGELSLHIIIYSSKLGKLGEIHYSRESH
ncbi:MAG: cobalt-precorrin-5B (C(1))-methyltransferase CbiD [Lachnospiraceae bacterium]